METHDRIIPMKVIGRKILAESDVNSLAKKRLALWIKELVDTRWLNIEAIKMNYPNVKEYENNRLTFNFAHIGIEVETLLSFDLGIICIEKVIELEAV